MRAFIGKLASCAVFAASVLFAGSADTNSAAASYYRIVVSTNTEEFAVVDSKKEAVTLYDRAGQVIWTSNVVAGLQSAPVLGQGKISGMEMYQGDLWVRVGRGYGIIAIKSGDLRGFSQN